MSVVYGWKPVERRDAAKGDVPRRRGAWRRLLSGIDRHVVQPISGGSARVVGGMTRGYARSLGWALAAAPPSAVATSARETLAVAGGG